MLAVAVTAMVPRNDPISGSGNERGKNVEGASKVRPTMHQKEFRV
jgi:hypothetical protein